MAKQWDDEMLEKHPEVKAILIDRGSVTFIKNEFTLKMARRLLDEIEKAGFNGG